MQTNTGPAAGFITALGVVAHEVGHMLVVAAFGTLFTVVGFVNERILALFTGLGGHAYFEFVCEGVRRMSGDPAQLSNANPWIAMWAPPVALSGPGSGNARVVVEATIDGVSVDAGPCRPRSAPRLRSMPPHASIPTITRRAPSARNAAKRLLGTPPTVVNVPPA